MRLTKNFIDKAYKKLNFKLDVLFNDYVSFVETYYQRIIEYYSGLSDVLDSKSFDVLSKIQKEFNRFMNLVSLNTHYFQSMEDFDNIEFIEEIRTKILTIQKSPKYFRSGKDYGVFSNKVTFDFVSPSKVTLENISFLTEKSNDFDNDWANIAIKNDLREEDYDTNGGNKLRLTTSSDTPNYKLRSVMDVMLGKNLYGKDFKKKIEFNIVESDIVVLNGENTIFQSADTLSTLKRGDIPEFPELGIDISMFVGSTLAAFFYSSLVRQMQDNFSIDDTFVGFKVTDVKYRETSFFVSFETRSFFGLTETKTVTL